MIEDKYMSYRWFVSGLVRQIKPEYVLEIGLGHGLAALEILKAMHDNQIGKYYCVSDVMDTHLISQYSHSYHLITKNSADTSAYENLPSFDVILIDGDHSYEMVFNDIKKTLPFLKKDGIICLHDANADSVMRAIQHSCLDFNLKSFYFQQFYTTVLSL